MACPLPFGLICCAYTDEWSSAWACLTALWRHGEGRDISCAGEKHGLVGDNAQIAQLRDVVERRLEATQVVRCRVNALNGHAKGDGCGPTGMTGRWVGDVQVLK